MDKVGLSRHCVDRAARRSLTRPSGRRSLGAACLALSCAVLVGCGGELRLVPPVSPFPPVMTDTSTGAAATPVSTAVATQFSPVIWTNAIDPATSAPLEPVTSYRPDAPQIIAVMQTSGLTAGSTVEATWDYNNTSLDAFSTRLVPPTSSAQSWIGFHIARSPEVPWPVGTYQVTVLLNGTTVQKASIEVTE